MRYNDRLRDALIVLGGSTVLVWYLVNYTTFLGPYGTANDVYHEAILILLLFIAYVFFYIFLHLRRSVVD